MSTKVFMHGLNGKMGQTISRLVEKSDTIEFSGGAGSKELYDSSKNVLAKDNTNFTKLLNSSDVIVDFTNDIGNKSLFDFIKSQNINSKKLVIASTGLSEASLDGWRKLCESNDLSLLLAPNTSLGVLLTMQLSRTMAKVLSPLGFDIEITEAHHKFKKDSPSGTATFLADSICKDVDLKPVFERSSERKDNELGVFAIRGGSVFGEHTVHFMGQEEYLKLSHQALSRDLFGKGALLLAKWINGKSSGFYELEQVELDELV